MAYYSHIAQDAPVYKEFTQATPAELSNTVIFNSDGDYQIDKVTYSHTVAGTDVGAVSMVLRRAATGASISSGDTVHTSSYNLKGTVNTPTDVTLTPANTLLKNTDRIGVTIAGTPTAVAGVHVTVRMKRIRPLV